MASICLLMHTHGMHTEPRCVNWGSIGCGGWGGMRVGEVAGWGWGRETVPTWKCETHWRSYVVWED